jgi:hypothetical protein
MGVHGADQLDVLEIEHLHSRSLRADDNLGVVLYIVSRPRGKL